MDSNQKTFERKLVVQKYEFAVNLQRPEKTIFTEIGKRLAEMSVLDLGVGTGRTTNHIASRCREYTGVDYSSSMIEACRARFGETDRLRFEIGDARKLKFRPNTFDFVLFSFNGIDYVSHEDRLIAFSEIVRVAKPGGLVVFSTHNIHSIGARRLLRRIIRLDLEEIWRQLFIFSFNRTKRIAGEPHAEAVRDMPTLRTYYIAHAAQIAQLESVGLEYVRAYSLETGAALTEKQAEASDDKWLYYWASKPLLSPMGSNSANTIGIAWVLLSEIGFV